jgi:hypothetical protein
MSALELERSCVPKGDASPGDHAWVGQPMALGLLQRLASIQERWLVWPVKGDG